MTLVGHEFLEMEQMLRRALLTKAIEVDTGHWQGLSDVPMTKTRELEGVRLHMPIPYSIEFLKNFVQPNLPWAEDHFQERVAGLPLNPGDQYKNWPYYRGNVEQHQSEEEQKFSHTYMERFWPRRAELDDRDRDLGLTDRMGIRYRLGDLDDVLDLLEKQPTTRQAFLPIFFPEDTGAVHGGRIPCTLGYQFTMRNGRLHIYYFIRSCDFLRHFRDDVYMAARLCQWVLLKLKERGGVWDGVKPGELTMFMTSLHIFEGDLPKVKREAEEYDRDE